MANWLGIVLIAAVAWVIATFFLGIEILSIVGIVFVVSLLALAKGFGAKVAAAFPMQAKQAKLLGIALFAVFLFMGGYLGSFIPASVAPPSGEADTGVGESECWAMASEELRGKASSVVMNAYNMESNTPYSAAIDVNPTEIYKNGDFHTTVTDTSAASLTTGAVGQVLDFYGGGATYYGTHTTKCILTQADEIKLPAHAIVTDANMDVTCTDEDDSTALSAAGNTTQGDYDITMGAEEETDFFCKLKVNAANSAFRLGGVIIAGHEGTADTVDSVKVVNNDAGMTFVEKTVPDHFANYRIYLDGSGETHNTTDGYDTYYEAGVPKLMHEWDTVKVQYTVKSGGTDPAADTDNAPTTKTAVYIYHVDAQWTRGDDGEMHLATHTQDSSEDNVGLAELVASPVGSTLGVAIELI